MGQDRFIHILRSLIVFNGTGAALGIAYYYLDREGFGILFWPMAYLIGAFINAQMSLGECKEYPLYGLIKGDHLIIRNIFYSHHGIYIGDGQAIEFVGFAGILKKEGVRIVDVKKYEYNEYYLIKDYREKERKYRGEEVVARAQYHLNRSTYNVFLRNCESLARGCVTGSYKSIQSYGYFAIISDSASAASYPFVGEDNAIWVLFIVMAVLMIAQEIYKLKDWRK